MPTRDQSIPNSLRCDIRTDNKEPTCKQGNSLTTTLFMFTLLSGIMWRPSCSGSVRLLGPDTTRPRCSPRSTSKTAPRPVPAPSRSGPPPGRASRPPQTSSPYSLTCSWYPAPQHRSRARSRSWEQGPAPEPGRDEERVLVQAREPGKETGRAGLGSGLAQARRRGLLRWTGR